MRVERRDLALQLKTPANQQWEEPVPEAKPYDIPKQLVWEAYQRVKANRGAAGVDGVSLATFEKRVSERMCKQVSVSLPYRGDSHDDRLDNYTGTTGSTAC